MERESRFVEHEKHVDIEEFFDKLGVWVVTRCNIILAPKKLRYEGTEKERNNQAVKAHYYRNRKRILSDRSKKIYKKYNLTKDEYNKMVENQGGACAICGKKKKLVIDHDHETGMARQLLCTSCNVGIGLLQDSPSLLEIAKQYIIGHKKH